MKRRLIVISFACVVIVAIAINVIFANREEKEEVVQNHSEHHMNTPYEDLDHLVKESAIIVSGIIRDVSDFDSVTKEYLFTIDEELKGRTRSDRIYIYENTPIFEIGQEYVLFLSKQEGGLFPEPVHTTIDPGNVPAIHDHKVAHNYSFLGQDLTKERFFHAIRTSRFIQTQPSYIAEHGSQSRMLLELDTVEEIYQASDFVAHVKPNYVGRENKYFKRISADVLELYKGDRAVANRLKDEAIIYVPASTELNREYIIFLKEHDGVYQVTTRHESIIHSQDREKWEEVRRVLERVD